jgi:hypothetical protein
LLRGSLTTRLLRVGILFAILLALAFGAAAAGTGFHVFLRGKSGGIAAFALLSRALLGLGRGLGRSLGSLSATLLLLRGTLFRGCGRRTLIGGLTRHLATGLLRVGILGAGLLISGAFVGRRRVVRGSLCGVLISLLV